AAHIASSREMIERSCELLRLGDNIEAERRGGTTGGTTMERWYRFLARDLKPLYGYGTLNQAFEFAKGLNCARDIIYSTRMLTDDEAQELGLADNTEAFPLKVALAEGGVGHAPA